MMSHGMMGGGMMWGMGLIGLLLVVLLVFGIADVSIAVSLTMTLLFLADVRSKVADLRAMEAALEILVAKCEAGLSSACPLIEALSNI